jgi:methionyl-tRNA formyltransferase
MRVLYLANNRVAPEIARHIRSCGDEIVALVMHPQERRKFGEEIVEAAGVGPSVIFEGSKLREATTLDSLAALLPEIGICAFFGYILRSELLQLLPKGCLNLHTAMLPYNRGANPNVWSIVDRTPAGVTLHYVDESIDTGDIIAQRPVAVEPVDTGKTLYSKLEAASIDLFTEQWPRIRACTVVRKPQTRQAGTFHRLADVESIDPIDLNRFYRARDLIDVLRARTFPPYPGAYMLENGRRVYLRLQLMYERQLEEMPPEPPYFSGSDLGLDPAQPSGYGNRHLKEADAGDHEKQKYQNDISNPIKHRPLAD